jgi:hypothetical protein
MYVMAGPATVKVFVADEAELEFCTVMLCGPAEASCVLVTFAVSDVALP